MQNHVLNECPLANSSVSSTFISMLMIRSFSEVTGQNVPMSKRPNVKTSHSQNVPSQNVPKLKRPKSKRPKVKKSQVKTSKVKTDLYFTLAETRSQVIQ